MAESKANRTFPLAVPLHLGLDYTGCICVGSTMKLTAYVLDGHTIDIRPAPIDREWMDKMDQRFAYRCLPLSIANAHGWEILCAAGFTAVWDGGRALDAVMVITDDGGMAPALGHFGFGVLTFHVPCLFRTEVGFNLMVSGNSPARKRRCVSKRVSRSVRSCRCAGAKSNRSNPSYVCCRTIPS
jgi:hypothetical protein